MNHFFILHIRVDFALHACLCPCIQAPFMAKRVYFKGGMKSISVKKRHSGTLSCRQTNGNVIVIDAESVACGLEPDPGGK